WIAIDTERPTSMLARHRRASPPTVVRCDPSRKKKMHMFRRNVSAATGAALCLFSGAVAQERLPFPAAPSGSTAGPTIAESNYAPKPPARRLPAGSPNVVVLMLDDVGPAL